MEDFEEDPIRMLASTTKEIELLKEAHTNLLRTSATTLQEDKDQLMKLYDSFSTSCGSLTQEMVEYTMLVERILQSTTHDNKSKALALLKSLQNCFTIPDDKLMQAMEQMKQQQLFVTQQIFKDYLMIKKDEVLKARSMLSNYDSITLMVQPTSSPVTTGDGFTLTGSNCDTLEQDRLYSTLQDIAPLLPVLDFIQLNEIYAVLNKDGKWCRATLSVPYCDGIFQLNDGVLYDCFLLDVGQHEHIAKRNIRLLPNNLTGLSSYTTTRLTLQSLTDDVRSAIGNKPSKGLPKEVGVRAFDVTLPPPGFSNPEEDVLLHSQLQVSNVSKSSATAIAPLYSSIISNHLASLSTPIETLARQDTAVRKYKPKFSLSEQHLNPPKYAEVLIVKAFHPKAVYVRMKDADSPRYRKLLKDLQKEFRGANFQSASYCESPKIGHPYAYKCGSQWYRVEIERSISDAAMLMVFFVDTGYRYNIKPEMMFHYLPDRFLELPAQAIKCSLLGVHRKLFKNADGSWDMTDQKFPQKVFQNVMSTCNGKDAVAFFDRWWLDRNGSGIILGNNDGFPCEPLVLAVLYLDGDRDSINIQLGQHSMVHLAYNIEKPEHSEIRQQLAGQKAKGQIVLKEEAICMRNPFMNDEELIPAFFVGCTSPNAVYFRTPELAERFIKLQHELQFYFKVQLRTDVPKAPIQLFVGFIGALQCGDHWFRAKVVDLENYPDVAMFLVDIALFLNVNARDILHLPDRLKTSPKTLLSCSFSGVRPQSGTVWDRKTTQYVIDQMNGAEGISIGFRKDAKDLSTGNGVPVAVYICDKKKNPNLVPGTSVETNMSVELISLGLASSIL